MTKQTTIDFEHDHGLQGPVTCLGQEFASEDARREHFRNLLREKLKDPEFRKIEGFPIGEDEDIIALSDPPYYTACPNPWINDFITEWKKEKGDRPDEYRREPFASDVSEGKNDPIYNAHSYHTKVPHKAVMRYILHYTEPGDIIFDGFCGTGMAGVAAYLCGDKKVVEPLGYTVKDDGTILDEAGIPFSKLGVRKAVLNDLSPAATFIAANYNSPVDIVKYEKEAKCILEEVEEEYGWMFETLHTDGKTKGKINYAVWSDVFVCPNCSKEVVFLDVAIDHEAGRVKDKFPCPHCGAVLNKRNLERSFETVYDSGHVDQLTDNGFVYNDNNEFDSQGGTRGIIRQAKQVQVMISYSIGSTRYQKKPDHFDHLILEKIQKTRMKYWFPTNALPDGFNTQQPITSHNLTRVHQFYTRRNLIILSKFWSLLPIDMKWIATSFLWRNLTRQNRFVINKHNPKGRINGPLTGTLYIPSEQVEQSIFELFREKTLKEGWDVFGNVISTESSSRIVTDLHECVDYIFTDPPFGGNYMYSELNFIMESWLKCFTNNEMEAIENPVQSKKLVDYQSIMRMCFAQFYALLKPGRWMTVEFHNSKNSVWNAIQESLQQAGFVVADVRTLDKVHGGIKASYMASAVKQDLIISCYKPNGGVEERFSELSGTEEGVWDFVRNHLKQLPRVVVEEGKIQIVAERQKFLLYDRMVAFYLRRNALVPLSSAEFYRGLEKHFPSRDEMYFLPEQVVEYDKTKMKIPELAQMDIFVTDEVSAIQWLRQLLNDKPQSFQEIHPQFMREIAGWKKIEKSLELSQILEENFLKYDGKSEVPSQIHSYLSTNWKELRNLSKEDPALKAKAKDRWYVPDPNKQADLEQMRERALLREFWTYLPKDYKPKKINDAQTEIPNLPRRGREQFSAKRHKVIRAEAVRAGFKHCWENRDYDTIILVSRLIPQSLLEEDPKLLMYYDQAVTRTY